jgi:hypothetical protein
MKSCRKRRRLGTFMERKQEGKKERKKERKKEGSMLRF